MNKPIYRTPQEVKKLWVKALRSGKYKQTKDRLQDPTGFCCLGVLCDLAAKDGGPQWDYDFFDGKKETPPNYILEYLKLKKRINRKTIAETLIDMNDDEGKSFKQIANFIEKNVLL